MLASSQAGATLVIYKLGRSGTTLSRLFHAVLGLETAVDMPALKFATASTCAEIEAIIPTWAIFIPEPVLQQLPPIANLSNFPFPA